MIFQMFILKFGGDDINTKSLIKLPCDNFLKG